MEQLERLLNDEALKYDNELLREQHLELFELYKKKCEDYQSLKEEGITLNLRIKTLEEQIN